MTEIDGDEYEKTIRKLAEKKIQEIKGDKSVLSRKGKLYRYLVQKGYERDLIVQIMKDYIK